MAAISARWRSTRETGEVEILRYSVVDDVGTVMNPLLLEGQIYGGVAQGVGPGADGGHLLRADSGHW